MNFLVFPAHIHAVSCIRMCWIHQSHICTRTLGETDLSVAYPKISVEHEMPRGWVRTFGRMQNLVGDCKQRESKETLAHILGTELDTCAQFIVCSSKTKKLTHH